MSAVTAAFAESGHGILSGMSTRPRSQARDPMTLGNMRANGVRSLDVCCWLCHHRAILSADTWSDDVPAPLNRAGCSRQFGRASAPMMPHRVHTMRGPNDGTGT